jgi:hypothetical protein
VVRDDRGQLTRVFDEHGEELLTLRGAAAELGLSRSTLQTLINQDPPRLAVQQLDDRTVLVRRSEIERYRRENLGKRGRPKKMPSAEPQQS